MDRRLEITRAVVGGAAAALVPTVLMIGAAPAFTAAAVFEAALLATATAYAVLLGIYRYPR